MKKSKPITKKVERKSKSKGEGALEEVANATKFFENKNKPLRAQKAKIHKEVEDSYWKGYHEGRVVVWEYPMKYIYNIRDAIQYGQTPDYALELIDSDISWMESNFSEAKTEVKLAEDSYWKGYHEGQVLVWEYSINSINKIRDAIQNEQSPDHALELTNSSISWMESNFSEAKTEVKLAKIAELQSQIAELQNAIA